jgi:thiol-disulfide isomerase/thioredoxin
MMVGWYRGSWVKFLCPLVLTFACAASTGCQKVEFEERASATPRSSQKEPETKPEPVQVAAADTGNESTAKPDGVPTTKTGEDPNQPPNPFPQRVKAPGLTGGVAWINTAGPLELEELRGKFVLLDFWTYCCINCMHILPELKKLEHAYPNNLVVIGVHSAKFENEEDSRNITEAVERYEIEHPVVNDAKHAIWNEYGITSWPTMLLIDPEGYAVYARSGEVQFETLDAVLKTAIPYYRRKGVLDEKPLKFDLAASHAQPTPLRYPGKILADEPGNRLFISDSNHNRIVIAALDGTLIETIGSGKIGADDGDFTQASFNHPQGAAIHGDTLYVADTENHLLRKIDLKQKRVTTIAGTGGQGRNAWPGLETAELHPLGEPKLPERFVGKPRQTGLNSPWALLVHGTDLFIAMAGPHQIWKMPLDESEIGPYAGNGREDIVDGPLLPKQPYDAGFASFAQPSGLASDGTWLYVADSEGSSIRAVPFDAAKPVKTIIGTSHLESGRLFDFGDVDGEGLTPKLQHALDVAYYNGKLYVADTYNNKIKVVDAVKCSAQTIAGSGKPGVSDEPATFDEPAGLSVAAGRLYIADTNNHAIRIVDLSNGNRVSTLPIKGLEVPGKPQATEPVAEEPPANVISVQAAAVKATDKAVTLSIKLTLPAGFKINPLAPMRYKLSSTAASGPVDRSALGKSVKLAKPAAEFSLPLPLTSLEGKEPLQLTLSYFYCAEGDEGVCKSGSVAWNIPLELTASAQESAIPLLWTVE